MPWQPLPRIAFAVATYPFPASSPADLPLEIGDELYIIEETPDGNWLRGYLVAPPSLLTGLTSVKGQTLEARVFSGIFPRSCVEVRELLGEPDDIEDDGASDDTGLGDVRPASDSAKSGLTNIAKGRKRKDGTKSPSSNKGRVPFRELPNGTLGSLSVPVKRDPYAPKPAAPVPMLKIGDETPTSASEPLIDEIASCLREWHSTNLHQLLLSRQYARLDQLSQLISSLNLNRQQFLYNVLTSHEYDRLREKTVWDLVRVNKLCGGEVIVRDPDARGRVLTGDDCIVKVTKLQSVMSLLDEPPQIVSELTALHHLLAEVKGFAGASIEETSLVVYLVSKPQHGKPSTLSESFSVVIPAGGTIGGLAKNAQVKTLFTDLSSQDIGDVPSAESELYLVVKVLAAQQILPLKPPSRSGTAPTNSYSRDPSKPMSSSGGKTSRRSLMWGSKGSRSAFSRGSPVNRMDPVTEQHDERPATNGVDSRDGHGPPSTAGSRTGGHVEGMQMADRTIGVGVLRLNSIMKEEEEVEHVVSIWSQSARFTAEKDAGEDWDPLVKELLDSPTGHYEKSRRGERLQVHLKGFNHSDADALMKATPTLLSGVCRTSKMGFSGAPTKPRSDIYLTLNDASLAKQNLLSRYGGSATAMPTGIFGSNLQITLEVRKSSGERIDNCIFTSSNTDGMSTFKSVAAERGESWAQTLRLSLPQNDVSNSHVVMFLSDMPNPPFAVAHMPLWDEAFIRDGLHGLLLYKIDENTSTARPGPSGRGGYLSLQWRPRGRGDGSVDLTGPLAILRVETYLCSTRFSQDRVILGLLKWKDLPREEVPSALRQLVFVPEIEVVKLLSDVLDSLFGILVEYSGSDEYEDLVFSALVRVLSIVHDRRFNLGPLVDSYAENKFNYPFATQCLMRSFTRLLEKPTEPEIARKLRATFKVAKHILKFITHARGQQMAKEAGIGITSTANGFTRSLRSIFKALDEMMRNSSPALVGSQTLAVQHFHTWLPELAGLLRTEEILHIAIDFMDSCEQVKGKLVLYKLILIIKYSKLDLFAHADQKAALSTNTVRWITPHWGHAEDVNDQWREQIRLCCSVLASQVDHLGAEIPDHIPKIIDSYLAILASPKKPNTRLSLLFPSSYPFPTKPISDDNQHFDEALIELSAVLSAISSSHSGMQLELADDDLTTLLENLLRVQMSILKGEAYPAQWLSVHIHHHRSTMRTLQYLASIMLDSFLPEPDDAESFNTELWKLFFTTLLKLVASTSLALETFPEQKRRAVWKIAGDVREHGAELLRRTWEAIGWEASPDERSRFGLPKMGGYQVQYVPTLVGPIVELCLSVHEGLRKMAVEVLQTMIVSEWTLSEDLSVIQTEVIDCLDLYFKQNPLTESILQKLFISELLERFEPLSDSPDDPLFAAMKEVIGTIDEFLDLLVAVHGTDDSGEATHLINRLRLMEFLRDMQKEEIFVRYVHQLANLQSDSRHHTEAGLALRLHADLYEWDPSSQTPALTDPEFPAQTQFERKEKIYFDMIKHFEEGEAWHDALVAYKELQDQYANNIFDFSKLARTERAIATIYETITKSDKLVPKYFKVVYKGLGFPPSIRDKEYVYQGSPTERASAFTDRMQEQYPAAQIVTGGDLDDAEGQFLVISAITPHRDLTHQVFQRARVPQVIRDFMLSSQPQTFSISTKRSTTGHVQEHFAEKLVFTTADPFPTILRRSEIVETHELRLSAHDTALERIVRKTQEMTALERRVGDGDDDLAQLLLDAVSVSVNPSSENSVACYRQLLPQPKEVDEEEDDDEESEEEIELSPEDSAIKMALVDHALMIKRCLAMFSRSSNELLTRRHEELKRSFESTFAPEIAHFTPPQPQREVVSTPSPTWRRDSPSDEQSPKKNLGLLLNGVTTEEASVIRPVSVRQRGTRLSFLGGKKKELETSTEVDEIDTETSSIHSRTTNRTHQSRDGHRLSFFRTQSVEKHEVLDSPISAKASLEVSREKKSFDGSGTTLTKKTSVRKRLSLLKLGKKNTKSNGMMGSLDEE